MHDEPTRKHPWLSCLGYLLGVVFFAFVSVLFISITWGEWYAII